MRFFKLAIVILSLGLIASCGNGDKSAGDGTATGTGSMAQLAQDEDFRGAHVEPQASGYQGKGQMVTFPTPDGAEGKAYVLSPENPGNKYLFVFQEWWGLNEHIKEEADRLSGSLDGVTVMALDLYDGKVATTREQAATYMQAADEARLEAIVKGALAKVGTGAEIATIGWCFGGAWSLRAAILAGSQAEACVMYYGMPVQEAAQLAPLQAPVLGLFARKDQHINEKVVKDFQNLAKATGKTLEVHQFDADHAFANPSNPDFDAEAARKANDLALDFLKSKL
jgi:carboxymethylenebutenolidase